MAMTQKTRFSFFRSKPGSIALLVLVSGGLWMPGCGEKSESQRPNILLICVDTLRADHMPSYGYGRPTTVNVSRFFEDAEVFDRAYSAASYTSASVVSMLSGLNPGVHGVRDFFVRLSPSIRILPEYLKDLGYQTAGVVSNTILTEEALGIGNRFDRYDDFVDERESFRKYYERRASRTTDSALRWLALEREPGRSHFLFLHYMDPHAPYDPPQDEISTRFAHRGNGAFPFEKPAGYQQLPGVTDALDYTDRYDEEIAFVDRELGRFLEAYEKQGLLEDAILIFTADHGETLFDHQKQLEHSANVWIEVVRVPLLIRWPGGQATRNTTAVSLIDLVPTLMQYLGEEIPSGLQGIPLRDRRGDDFLFQEAWLNKREKKALNPKRSVIRGQQKWAFRVSSQGVLRELWYTNLNADPHEKAGGDWPADSDRLRKRIRAELDFEASAVSVELQAGPGRHLKSPKIAPPLEAHQREALKALGYLE
jgi:arylsulfatase A-like enzyme